MPPRAKRALVVIGIGALSLFLGFATVRFAHWAFGTNPCTEVSQ